jgi:hypothetical protein
MSTVLDRFSEDVGLVGFPIVEEQKRGQQEESGIFELLAASKWLG